MNTSPMPLIEYDLGTLRNFRETLAAKFPEVTVQRVSDLGVGHDDLIWRAGQRSVIAELDGAIRVATEKRKS